MLEPNFFNQLFVYPILNLLVLLYKGFSFFKIPGAFGWAIIGLTLIIRLLLNPFFKSQMNTAKKLSEVKPHLDHLSKKHKDDPKRLQQEQLKLYQQHGINPASGCLFMIIQLPVFIALYQTLSLFLFNGKKAEVIVAINKALYHPLLKITSVDPWFLGFNLALSPQKSGQLFYLLIPLLSAVLQYFQFQATSFSQTGTLVSEEIKNKKQEEKKKEQSDAEQFQKAMNTQMKFVFPLMFAWFSYTLPVGLSLYWNIFSLLSIVQYRKLKVKK
jgi:YidC/Oxa1 family membrane protein insertase